MYLLYFFGGLYGIAALVWALNTAFHIPQAIRDKKRLALDLEQFGKDRESHKRQLEDGWDRLRAQEEASLLKLKREQERLEAIVEESKTAMDRISKEKSLGFPWLASAYSEYAKLFELKLAKELERKKHPALRAGEALRSAAVEKAELRRENKILRELHRYYEHLFPWLIEFKGEDLDDLIRDANRTVTDDDTSDDPASLWLTEAERSSQTLTRAERYQRALDRYWQTKKSPWRIGRDYERYIGYLMEKEGFKVEFHGIEFGYEDLGRDLICKRGQEVRIVQCKYWSAKKTLHEKHVCQIFGTVSAYKAEQLRDRSLLPDDPEITAWLYVSCGASPKAREFATMLNVHLIDNFPPQPYPAIKCNVSMRDGTRIYHLPFDQQYDRTLIEFRDECYVQTVAEAEALGFRRAYRWRGQGAKP